MKKCVRYIAVLLMVVSVLCTCVSAMEYTNPYISSSSAYIHRWAAGDISVELSVTGTGTMDKIGVHRVTVYKMLSDERDSGSDDIVATYWYEDYPDMMKSKTFYYENSIRLKVEAGQRYYAVVVFYASLGGDGDIMPYSTKIVVG